eukprot:1446946-Rhodomonas_salina.1
MLLQASQDGTTGVNGDIVIFPTSRAKVREEARIWFVCLFVCGCGGGLRCVPARCLTEAGDDRDAAAVQRQTRACTRAYTPTQHANSPHPRLSQQLLMFLPDANQHLSSSSSSNLSPILLEPNLSLLQPPSHPPSPLSRISLASSQVLQDALSLPAGNVKTLSITKELSDAD